MRKENWEKILAEKIEEHRNVPFYWGESDCLYWTGDLLKALTGSWPVEEYMKKTGKTEPTYSTHRGMKKAVKSYGFETFTEMMHEIFGKAYKKYDSVLYAKRGDLLAKMMPAPVNMFALGINTGRKVMFKTIQGTLWFELRECDFAWRVE